MILKTVITSNCFLFAGDGFLLEKVEFPGDCACKLSHDLSRYLFLAKRWLVTMNEIKTEPLFFLFCFFFG